MSFSIATGRGISLEEQNYDMTFNAFLEQDDAVDLEFTLLDNPFVAVKSCFVNDPNTVYPKDPQQCFLECEPKDADVEAFLFFCTFKAPVPWNQTKVIAVHRDMDRYCACNGVCVIDIKTLKIIDSLDIPIAQIRRCYVPEDRSLMLGKKSRQVMISRIQGLVADI